MIELIMRLAQLLARDELAVQDVVDAVGAVANDPGVPMPISLTPSADGVRAAWLARYPDSGLPYVLTLDFTPHAAPTVGDLSGAFGSYGRLPSDRGAPVAILFAPTTHSSRWSVTLIAELRPHTVPDESITVQTVALRRDPLTATVEQAVSEVHA